MNGKTKEGNTAVTLHNQSWFRIVQVLREEENPTAQAMANVVEMQVPAIQDND